MQVYKLLLFMTIATVAVFFFIFGFASPDPHDCYYFPGLDYASRD